MRYIHKVKMIDQNIETEKPGFQLKRKNKNYELKNSLNWKNTFSN